MFYGDRSAGVYPLGNHWWIHTHIEDVSEEEMMRRAREQQGSLVFRQPVSPSC